MVLLGTPSLPHKALKRENTTFFGNFMVKIAPHRRFGGSKFLATHIFSISNKKSQVFVKTIVLYLCCTKSYEPARKSGQIFTALFFGITLNNCRSCRNPESNIICTHHAHQTCMLKIENFDIFYACYMSICVHTFKKKCLSFPTPCPDCFYEKNSSL